MVCFFIVQLPRNYREGKCFFGTSIGLLITWAIWLTCFILMEPESRDTVVSFAIIATAYLIIVGVLIPRTYYMVNHLARGKEFGQRFGSTDLGPDPRINTIMRQVRATNCVGRVATYSVLMVGDHFLRCWSVYLIQYSFVFSNDRNKQMND